MATAAIAGYAGSVAGPTGATEIKSWTANVEIAGLDATSMSSSGWREYISGLSGVTGSFTSIGGIVTHGASTLTLKTKTVGGVTLTGSAIVTKVTPTAPVDGVVDFNCDFVFTGSVGIT